MSRVPSNTIPDAAWTISPGTEFVLTREIAVNLDRVGSERTVTLPRGARVRHVHTDYAAECVPAIEYADVTFEVMNGEFAGCLIAILTFEMDDPVPELLRLASEYGIVTAPSHDS